MIRSLMWSSSGLNTRDNVGRVIAYEITWRHYIFVKPLFVYQKISKWDCLPTHIKNPDTQLTAPRCYLQQTANVSPTAGEHRKKMHTESSSKYLSQIQTIKLIIILWLKALFLILHVTLYFIKWNCLTLYSNINHIYKQWFYKSVMPAWGLIGNNSSYIIPCIQAWRWSHEWSKHVALYFIL
jgi:hypothetical protein